MRVGALRSDARSSISRIIEAARRVFASGDGSGTLSRIADEAGVGVATLYRHFPSRQALAHAVYERIFSTEIEPLFVELAKSNAPRAMLLDVAERLVTVVQNEKGLVSSIGNLTEATTVFLRRSSEPLRAVVARAQAAGSIRSDIDAEDIPNILAVAVTGLAVLGSDKATRRRYLSLLLDAMSPTRATRLPL
ncbi:TetR/AcrR family transcriptional regulator [soil metagenome]